MKKEIQNNPLLIWDTKSQSSEESMPLGGGGLGLNIWVEDNDLLIYYQLSGTFDEHNGFPKLGRLRISFAGKLMGNAIDFRQILNTQEASVTIKGKDFQILVWVHIHQPVFHIEMQSSQKSKILVSYENWRFEDRISPAETKDSYIFGERNDIFGYWMYPYDLIRYKDTIFQKNDHIYCYHKNNNDDLAFDKEMDQQGFNNYKVSLYNPQKDLIFGSSIFGENLKAQGISQGQYLGVKYKAFHLKSKQPQTHHLINVFCLADQLKTAQAWIEKLNQWINDYQEKPLRAHRQKTLSWWHDYWQRSWIQIKARKEDEKIMQEVDQVSKNYRYFRFMQAFNHNGKFPLKFNGGNLTYDSGLVRNIELERDVSQLKHYRHHYDTSPNNLIEANDALTILRDFGPDYRAWGGGSITPQNQRLLYWPMLKSGDFDLMEVQFNWYNNTLKTAELRSQLYWGHGGCCYTEQINNFGLPIGSHYGWERDETIAPGDQINPSCHMHYSTQLEFAYMMILLHQYSAQDLHPYLEFIEKTTDFFFQHFEYWAKKQGRTAYDDDGYLIIYPSTALESYKEATNPHDVTCGLMRIFEALSACPNLSKDQQEYYQKKRQKIPPIAYREVEGKKTIAPAKDWSIINNVELPQMYPIFPYEIYGIAKPDLDVAIQTWKFGCNEIAGQKSYTSWHQDGIFCAHLGLIEEAKQILICKLANGGRKFPAFWGPGHDWVPDHNWGGSGLIQLQDMLLQTNGDDIILFPCWPKNWDVRFKLHAPFQTVVKCVYEDGEITELKVEPPHRASDIKVN